jgi:hypothetical protein
MKKLFQLALLCAVVAGCATAPNKIPAVEGADIGPLKTERAALSYKLVDKRINYNEVLYRVLWVENKASSQDFSGIWSADQDLTDYAVERLRAQGLKADSIYQAVDAKTIDQANAVETAIVRQNATTNHPSVKGAKLLPIPLYFTDLPTEREFTTLATQLRSKGYRYLIEMTAMGLTGNAIGYGGVIVAAEPNLRVIDLQLNKVVWNANVGHSELYQLGGDLKKLEVDDMAKTKEGLRAGIQKINFSNLWGL